MIRKTEGIGFWIPLRKNEVDSPRMRNQNRKRTMKAVAVKNENNCLEERCSRTY